jgi:hypothetical protein
MENHFFYNCPGNTFLVYAFGARAAPFQSLAPGENACLSVGEENRKRSSNARCEFIRKPRARSLRPGQTE